MQQVSSWVGRDSFPLSGDNANSVYLLTPKGSEWEVAVRFEKNTGGSWASIPLSLPEPVRVIRGADGSDDLRYNSSVMELGKIYPVTWNGKRYGLRKTARDVEILRFYPDGGHGD